MIKRSELEVPLGSADSHLNQMVTGSLEGALQQREVRSTPLRARVEQVVSTLLPKGKASAENVANELSLSSRTFEVATVPDLGPGAADFVLAGTRKSSSAESLVGFLIGRWRLGIARELRLRVEWRR